jgi:nitrite reductase/ring-hydroxylating ferredoxin subunit
VVSERPARKALSEGLSAQRPMHFLCLLAELEDGRSKGFDPLREGRDTMFVLRRGKRVLAYRNACPHYDFARMAWKKDEYLNADGSRIQCSAHGALFRIEDGVCEIGPCVGERLTPVALEHRGDEIWLVGAYSPGLRRNVALGDASAAGRPTSGRASRP